MSFTKRASRRLSLLAGSSVFAASISAAASLAVVSAPTAVLAYDECAPAPGTGTLTDGPGGVSDPSLNGAAPDTFNCPSSFPPVAPAYTPEGVLTLNVIRADTDVGPGIRISSGSGDVVVNVSDYARGAGIAEGPDWAIELGTSSTSDVTLNNLPGAEIWGRQWFNIVRLDPREYVAGQSIRGSGLGDVTINNEGLIWGRMDFADLPGLSTINIQGTGLWETSGLSEFGPGETHLIIEDGGAFTTGYVDFDNSVVDGVVAEIDFGGGGDLFANAGYFILHPGGGQADDDPADFEAETRLIQLADFHNSGTVVLGGASRLSSYFGQTAPSAASDMWYDDILSMPGATFVGLDGGRIVMDVNLNASQAACDGALRNSDGDMPAADCVAIVGGATEGVTLLTVNDLFQGDRGGLNEIVLIDVSGGTSAQGHFVLDPSIANYSPAYGGVIQKNFFFYPLVYDESTQQHKLVGVMGENAMQFPILAQAAQAMWRTSTGTWLDRQADLRGGLDGHNGGVWMRVRTEFADRDTLQSSTAAGTTFDFAGSTRQETYAVTGGADLIAMETDAQSFLAGVMLGYSNSNVEFAQNDNTTELNGWSGGAYASLVSGPMFVDAVVNANKAIMESSVPSLDLFPEGSLLRTDVLSVGGQLEAGWRMPIGGSAFVEPLAAVSYVRTSSDVIQVKSADPARNRIDVDFDDPTSLRAALGLRAGLNQDYGSVRAQYSVLARRWHEFEDETAVSVTSLGTTAHVFDEFSGGFNEFAVGASVYGLDDVVSGFFNFGGTFGDDYESQNLSAGVRVNW